MLLQWCILPACHACEADVKTIPVHLQLASGANDNLLHIWQAGATQPLHRLASHTAAVKVRPQPEHTLSVLLGAVTTLMSRIFICCVHLTMGCPCWCYYFKYPSGTPLPLLSFSHAISQALAWCPFQSNLLASGGGTADRCIKTWNTLTGAMLNSVDTKSQVRWGLCCPHSY